MSSQRQIEANRRNAQKSTGPKTEEGKNACRFNAVRHGFTAERFVVAHEDESEFDDFRNDFYADHAPATATETFLVEQMVAAAWRIRRIRNAEAAFWNLETADRDEDVEEKFDDLPEAQYFAYTFGQTFYSTSAINNLSRYEARLERAFYKALHELERLRRERPPQQIGSVSQKPKIVPRPVPPTPIAPSTKPSKPLTTTSEPPSQSLRL